MLSLPPGFLPSCFCVIQLSLLYFILFLSWLIDLYWRIRSTQWVLKYNTWNCTDWSTISCLAVSIDLTEKKCSHGAAEVTFEMHDLIIGDWDWLWFTDRVCCITVYAGVCVCVCVCVWPRKRLREKESTRLPLTGQCRIGNSLKLRISVQPTCIRVRASSIDYFLPVLTNGVLRTVCRLGEMSSFNADTSQGDVHTTETDLAEWAGRPRNSVWLKLSDVTRAFDSEPQRFNTKRCSTVFDAGREAAWLYGSCHGPYHISHFSM